MSSTPPGVALLRGWVPPRPILFLAVRLLLVILVCCLVPAYLGGFGALLAFSLGVAGGVPAAVSEAPRRVKLATGGLLASGAVLGVLSLGHPAAAAAAVLAVGLAQAPLNTRSSAIAGFAPVLVSVFATVELDGAAPVVGAWVVAGYAAVHVVVGRFGVPRTARPLDPALAWRHALVFALAAGAIQVVLMRWGTPHGYWLVLTLAMVLRPEPSETRSVGFQHALGTLSGVLLALIIVWFLPQSVALLLALPCAALMIAWAAVQEVRKQALFGTPVVVLIGSAGALNPSFGVAAERLVLTLLGVVVAGAAVLILESWDRRSVSVGTTP